MTSTEGVGCTKMRTHQAAAIQKLQFPILLRLVTFSLLNQSFAMTVANILLSSKRMISAIMPLIRSTAVMPK